MLKKILFVIICALSFNQLIFAQMPPSPGYLDKINKNLIPKPYTLQNLDQLRKMGVDKAWSNKRETGKNQKLILEKNTCQSLPIGDWKILVILVQFPDQPALVGSDFFDDIVFGNHTGTLKDYYKAISYNKLNLTPGLLPSQIGWVMAPQNYTYYVDGENGFGVYPHNTQRLVEDIISELDSVIDFSEYDNNNDGYVDGIFIVHSGKSAESGGGNETIWSHAWQLSTPITADGVSISSFSIEPEFNVTPGDLTVGVFAHEYGHAGFGLPDLYDTDYSSDGLGFWSLMGKGCWNGTINPEYPISPEGNSPAFPDAFSQIKMGFAAPKVVTSNATNQTIANSEETGDIYLLWKNGIADSEYFLVQNRQKTSYDSYLPGNGLLIYHVDESVLTSNQKEWYPGHTNDGHYIVALEQADNMWHLEKRMVDDHGGDPFPGFTNNRNFTASEDYNFNITGVSITNISNSGPVMSADFKVIPENKSLLVISPNGGEFLNKDSLTIIRWTYSNVSSIKIECSYDNGLNWNIIKDSCSAVSRSFNWKVPSVSALNCKIKISDISNPLVSDESDRTFKIGNDLLGNLACLNGVWMVDSLKAFAVGDVGKILKTTDGGKTWANSNNSGSQTVFYNVCFTDSLHGFTVGGCGNNGAIIYTTDGGKNWMQQNHFDLNILTAIAFSDPENGMIVGIKGSAAKTTDGGASWTVLNSGTSMNLWGISYPDPNTAFAIGESPDFHNNIVLRTTNGGATWDSLSVGASNRLFSVWFTDASHGVIAGMGGLIVRTDNGGTTWEIQKDASSTFLNSVHFVDCSNGYITGYMNTVLHTTNGGRTWDPQYACTPYLNLKSVHFINKNTGMIVGENGLVLRTDDGGNSWIKKQTLFNIRITSPVGGEKFVSDSTCTISWIYDWTTFNEDVRIEYSSDCGNTWGYIAIVPSSLCSYKWVVPKINSEKVRIRIYGFIDYNEYDILNDYIAVSTPVVSVKTDNDLIPDKYSLQQNYPNPFNPSTVISYTIPVGTRRGVFVQLKVYDVIGREVAVLVNEEKPAGNYKIKFNGSNLPSGVYFYRIQAGSFTDTKKFVLLK